MILTSHNEQQQQQSLRLKDPFFPSTQLHTSMTLSSSSIYYYSSFLRWRVSFSHILKPRKSFLFFLKNISRKKKKRKKRKGLFHCQPWQRSFILLHISLLLLLLQEEQALLLLLLWLWLMRREREKREILRWLSVTQLRRWMTVAVTIRRAVISISCLCWRW